MSPRAQAARRAPTRREANENELSSDEQNPTGFDHALTIRAALATLPEDQRNVVILRHVIGPLPRRIADQMGRTEGSIDGLHHRGRRALPAGVGTLEPGPFDAGQAAGGRGLTRG